MKKKHILVPALALTLGMGILTLSSQSVKANSGWEGMPSFVQGLAEKLGVDQSKIETALGELRLEHQAEMQTKYEELLNEAVANGEITQEQKALIIQKHEEMKANRPEPGNMNREDFQNLSEEERQAQREEQRAKMEEQRQATETWAKDNGIDIKYLQLGFGREEGMRGGPGHRMNK